MLFQATVMPMVAAEETDFNMGIKSPFSL